MAGSRFVKKSERKIEHLHNLLHILMNENACRNFLLSFRRLFISFFLFFLHFYLLSYFEIIKCIVKSRTEKRKFKKIFWAPGFGCANRYTGLPNGLDTSLDVLVSGTKWLICPERNFFWKNH